MGEPGFWDRSGESREVIGRLKSAKRVVDGLARARPGCSATCWSCSRSPTATPPAWPRWTARSARSSSKVAELELESLLVRRVRPPRRPRLHPPRRRRHRERRTGPQMLLRMYMRWCERRGFAVTHPRPAAGRRGRASRTPPLEIAGEYAYGYLKVESGVHRLVRISPFDAAQRRHTSFASVFVYPMVDDTITVDIEPEGPAGRHLPRQRAPAASTSTRPSRRCASPTCPPASSCSRRPSAASTATATSP